MNFVKMMEDRGINLEILSDYEFSILLHAIPQEEERRARARIKREQLIAEYTDKFNDLLRELEEEGLAFDFNGYTIDIDKFTIKERMGD